MKKIISLSLVVMMLISLFVPSGAVFAADGNDVTEKVTVEKPDLFKNKVKVVEKGVSLGVVDGDKISKKGTITINYDWRIDDVKGKGIQANDFFYVAFPSLSEFFTITAYDNRIKVTNGDKTEILGAFEVDLPNRRVKMILNDVAAGKTSIENGFLNLSFTANKHVSLEVSTDVPNYGDILKFVERIVPKRQIGTGVYQLGRNFEKNGEELKSEDVIRWGLPTNYKEMIDYLNTGMVANPKKNVWVEDRLSDSNLSIKLSPIRLYPNVHLATEEGKLSSSAFYTSPILMQEGKDLVVSKPDANETYEEFKARIEQIPNKEPLTVYVYQKKNENDRDGILLYLGDIDGVSGKSYDKLMGEDFNAKLKEALSDLLNDRHEDYYITQAQYDNTIQMYGIDDDPNTEMKKVIGFRLAFDTTVKENVKGQFHNKASMTWEGGPTIEADAFATYDGKAGAGAGYTETVAVFVQKKWVGNEGKTKPEVTVKLLQDGKEFKKVKLGVANPQAGETADWSYTFSQLPKKDSATKVDHIYTVEEVTVPNYTVSYEPSSRTGNKVVITNTYTAPKTVVFKAKKEWVGPANGDVEVSLYGKDKNTPLQTLTIAANQQTVTFAEVPELDDTNTKIDYTVVETGRPANSEQIGDVAFEDATKTFVVKNRNTEKVEASITKKWIGQAKDELVVYLTINGVRSANKSHELHLAPNAHKDYNWKATVHELPKYDENGDPIAYSFEEELPNGYSQKPLEQNGYNVVITNVNNKEIDINVTKEWKNSSLEKVTVRLHATRTKGADAGTKEVGVAELSAANNWTHKFANNRAYDQETGEEIVYSVTEDKVPNFATEIKGNQKDGFTVVNTYLPPIPPYVPEVPAEPSEPTKPTPETPTEPTKPAPEVPTNPGTPTDVLPEDPTPQGDPNVKPTEPTKPQDPSVPETVLPENPIPQGNKELPKTDGIPAAAILLLGAGLAGLGAFFKKEK